MIDKLYIDSETRSEVPIRQGTRRYVLGEHFEPILVTWAVNDGPVQVWDVLMEPVDPRLQMHIEDPETMLVISNSTFDRWVFNTSNLFNFQIPASRIIDVMVQALAHGLPGGLDKQSEIFGLGDEGKDKDGRRLIQIFCTPNINKKTGEITFYDRKTHPDDWVKFVEYAKSDITAMRIVHNKLPKINYPGKEHALWVLDQKINDRGLPVDVGFAHAAVEAAADERKRLNAATSEATEGEVEAATQRDRLLAHIAKQHDVWLPDLKNATLERRLDDPDLPADLRELIMLRLQSSKNSAAKYRRVIQHEVGGYLHNTMQMYGAARTGRDAGRVFQPQNLMRAVIWRGLEGAALDAAIQVDVNSIKRGVVHLLNDNVMDVLGSSVRSTIAAKPGRKLVVADLSNIEGRGLVWLSDEEWKLKYFRDFDLGKIPFDNYVMAYAKSMNVEPSDVDGYGRQIGKVEELGLGYGGGVAAFITFANVYRLDLDELAEAVWASGDLAHLEDCLRKYEWASENGYHAGLPPRQYAACEYLKQQWRASHPKTVQFWADLEIAFRNATVYERETFRVGRLAFRRQGSWLYIRLPSGRCLVYANPRIQNDQVTFMGICPFTKRFKRVKTYSGRLAENVTSGTARDVMFHRMQDVEDAGYPLVLRVHDELVAHTPDSPEFSAEKLSALMAKPYPWSDGFPLAAAGFETYLYRKD